MTTEVIHKLNITAEASLDIKECLGEVVFDKRKLKAEVEEYIQNMSSSLPWWGYFRADYEDGDTERLKLFIYKGKKIGLMQYWELRGVCLAKDWSEEMEDEGHIRSWLNTQIEDIPEEDDWVVRYRMWQVIRSTDKTSYDKVLEEVKDVFECERDKEAAAKVAFLQSAYYEFSGRRRIGKKDKCNRKSNCIPR